jgi:hypothetical protein
MRAILLRSAAALLAVGMAVGMPAAIANAASGYTVTWINSEDATTTMTYACSAGIQTYYGENVLEVSGNGCGDRIWMHQYTDGDGNSYCINPGAITYGFSAKYGDFEQVEPTGNQADCDANTEMYTLWNNEGSDTDSYCIDGYTTTDPYHGPGGGSFYIMQLYDTCNVRIWIHNLSGGAVACVSPAGYGSAASSYTNIPVTAPAQQFQISGNQAPCSAG